MRLRTMLLSSVLCLPCATAALAAQQVGVTTAVNQSARGTPPSQQIRTITLGDAIIHDELIETDGDGLLQILLADGTTFTVGPSSSLRIDSFVYDRDAGTARIAATLGKGVFRFIGGQASKTPGGVTLDTPVGTVGIRGAIAGLDFSGKDPSSFRIDMQYGKEITLKTKDGQKKRLYEQGYSILFDKKKAFIKKTLEERIALFEKLMSGKFGKNGGAPEKPTGEMVTGSGIAQSNSNVPISFIPTPTPRPSYEGDDVVGDANRQAMRKEAREADPASGGGDDTGGDTGGDSGGDTGGESGGDTGGDSGGDTGGDTVFTEAPLRVLTADTDQTATLRAEEGAAEGTAEIAGETVTLPVYNDATFTAHEDASGVSSSLGTLSGTAYSGPGGFTAYLLGVGGDPAQPFYAITGTPTANVASTFQGSDVRHYSLTADPLQGVAVPFMTDNPVFDFSNAATSDLLVAETGDIADGSAKVFQSWLTIAGTGSGQTSAVGVNVGALAGDGSGLSLDRRGSYREAAGDISYALFGSAATLGTGEGGTLFGPNGENFVVSHDSPGDPGHFFDSPLDASGVGADFSTIHVGNLEGSVPATRSLEGTYNGFAAGVLERTVIGDGTATVLSPLLAYSTDPGNVTVEFDPGAKSVGGSITVADSDVEDVTIAFGAGIDGAEDGASAYIDDDTFGASANPDPAGTTAGTSDALYEQRHDAGAATYFVSSGSVVGLSEMDFMQGVATVDSSTDLDDNGVSDYLCSDCDFLKWGWWGTQAQMADKAGSDPNEEARRVSTHLGTWVIGDIADLAQVDALSSTVADYRGLAVGNVVSGSDTYVAAGRMDMNYNFGDRAGDLNISDFDGRDFSGTMNGATSGKATFSGSLSGSPGLIAGQANGAFVNNGSDIAAGVIGDFSVYESYGDWSATGIFAGKGEKHPITY